MKLKLTKRFSLSFFGEEWKDAYMNFTPLSIRDVKDKLPLIAKLQADPEKVSEGLSMLVDLLKEKFVDGKVVTEEGLMVLSKEDIGDLPIEVIGKAFSFLSAVETPSS